MRKTLAEISGGMDIDGLIRLLPDDFHSAPPKTPNRAAKILTPAKYRAIVATVELFELFQNLEGGTGLDISELGEGRRGGGGRGGGKGGFKVPILPLVTGGDSKAHAESELASLAAVVRKVTLLSAWVTVETKWVEVTVDPEKPDEELKIRKMLAAIAPELALDRLIGPLPGKARSASPKTLDRSAGILTPAQYRAIIAALEQTDGVEILTMPRIETAKNGRQSHVAVIDAFSVPSTAPAIKSIEKRFGKMGPLSGDAPPFDGIHVPLGPTLDLLANADLKKKTIRLECTASITEFVGFEIPGPAAAASSIPGEKPSVPPPFLPRFRKSSATGVSNVPDGSTLALGGMVTEETVTTEETVRIKKQIPKLGDLPRVGRVLRSASETSTRKIRFVFVTPTIVDNAGNPVNVRN